MISGVSDKELDVANARADLLLEIQELKNNKENLIKYLEDKIEECYRSGDCKYKNIYQDLLEKVKSDKYES